MSEISNFSWRPLWAQKMSLTDQEVLEITKGLTLSETDPRDQTIYEGIQLFSQKYQIDFDLCCASALDLDSYEQIDDKFIEGHLLKRLKNAVKDSSNSSQSSFKDYKTILLTGRSGEGKSTLVNHLTGRQDAEVGRTFSQTEESKLYVSDRCKLTIIDTPGLDGIDKPNEELMREIYMQTNYLLEIDTGIDAIIVMWCPLTNIRSGLVKTILQLQKIFGENVLDSCIVMIQGDWEKYGNPERSLRITDDVEKVKKEVKGYFPQIPIIRYDAMDSFESQLPLLSEAISKVQPYSYQTGFIQNRQRATFLSMAQAFKKQRQQIIKETPKRSFFERLVPRFLKH